MPKKKNIQSILEQPFTRRSWIDWLGKATVLTLTGDLIASCAVDDENLPDENSNDDGAIPNDACADQGNLLFHPGDEIHGVYKDWGERTVDIQDMAQILKQWQLRVDGLVEQPITLSFADLLSLTAQAQVTDFHCVEGWTIEDIPWNGLHLKTLFDMAKPFDSATHVTFHTIQDIYNESLPLDVALEPKTLLAYGIDCSTLPLKHGFPLRIVVPRKWAYKSAKYVYRIELDDKPIEGYWVARGYPYDADVPKDKLRPGKH
ncbi:MAG: molybdopterin-dependent oxidoreductase [Myxococcota bacterium]|nr:molybdopterin-dependent oxidoreductase [Myxococcota bacterium]